MPYVYRSLMPCIRNLLVKGTIFLAAKHARYLPMSQIVNSVRVTNVFTERKYAVREIFSKFDIICFIRYVKIRSNASHQIKKVWSTQIYIIRFRIMRKQQLNKMYSLHLYWFHNFNLRLCIAILIQLYIMRFAHVIILHQFKLRAVLYL